MRMYFCFKGNYDQYVKTREELEENQMKRFNWEQDQIAHMKVSEMLHHSEWTMNRHFTTVFNKLWINALDLAEQPPGTDVSQFSF